MGTDENERTWFRYRTAKQVSSWNNGAKDMCPAPLKCTLPSSLRQLVLGMAGQHSWKQAAVDPAVQGSGPLVLQSLLQAATKWGPVFFICKGKKKKKKQELGHATIKGLSKFLIRDDSLIK